MFISDNKKSKKTIYRLWFTILIIVTVVFGLVLIIYEEWQVDKDNLGGYVPYESTYFYIHFNQRAPEGSWWFSFPLFNSFADNFFPNFFQEFDYFSKQDFPEMSYVLFLDDGELVSGWLLAVHDNSISIDLPNEDWQRRSWGQVQVVSPQIEFLDKILPEVANKEDSLKKYLQLNKLDNINSNYLYLNANKKIDTQSEVFKLFRLIEFSQISGEWIFTHQLGSLQAQKLGVKPFFRLPSLSKKSLDWPQLFVDESLVFYGLSPEFTLFLLESPLLPPTLKEILTTAEEKYQISWHDLLPEVIGPINLSLALPQADWLVKTKITAQGQDIIKQAVSLAYGYYYPQPEEVLLPDGSKVNELKVKPISLYYQKIIINEKSVNIMYYDKDSYFAWFEEGREIILGNSLRMINLYIYKNSTNNHNPCLVGTDQLIIMNLLEFEKIFGIKRLILSNNNGLAADKFSFCYE